MAFLSQKNAMQAQGDYNGSLHSLVLLTESWRMPLSQQQPEHGKRKGTA